MNVPAYDCQCQSQSQSSSQFQQHLLPHKQKQRTEFRCRPIRSSSCTTKVNANVKNNEARKNTNLLSNYNEKQRYSQLQRSKKMHQNKQRQMNQAKIQKMVNNQLKINLHLNLNGRNRKIKLNVPRKISASPVPQSKNILKLQRLQPSNSISNSPSNGNSNKLFKNYSVKMDDLQIISLHSNGSQIGKQQRNTINDQRFYTHYNSPHRDSKMAINDIDIEYQSKATMKYNSQHQYQQLKGMLLELADNHNQMMSMLKYIVKERKQGQRNSQQHQQHGLKLIRQPSTNKQNLKINRAFNQKIESNPNPNPSATTTAKPQKNTTTEPPRLLKQKSISQSLKRGIEKHENLQIFNSKLPSFVASMLVQVLTESGGENYRAKTAMQEMVNLRELVSRRFQAYAMGYSQFLEMLIARNKKYMSGQQVRQMLRAKPFLLNQSQIQFLQSKLTLSVLCISPCPCPLIPISQLSQKLRQIINPQKSPSQSSTKMLIHHIKSALSTDGQQLAQMINNIVGNGNGNDNDNDEYIDYRMLERVLRQWKMGQEQIELVVTRLCVCSQSLEKLRYKAIFTGQLWY